ncbi:type II toxin-antitoxin system HicA family toxin [uncultured Rhodospira sp.]
MVRILEAHGFRLVRQRGSHIISCNAPTRRGQPLCLFRTTRN